MSKEGPQCVSAEAARTRAPGFPARVRSAANSAGFAFPWVSLAGGPLGRELREGALYGSADVAQGPEMAHSKRREGAASQGHPQPSSWGHAPVSRWQPKPGARLQM